MNATVKAGANEAPARRPGTPPANPNASKPADTKPAAEATGGGDTAVLERTETGSNSQTGGDNAGGEYVKKADLDDFAAKIINGFMDRMEQRRRSEARDRPAFRSDAQDFENFTPERSMDIPVDGSIEGIDRPDLIVEHGDVDDIAQRTADGRAKWEADMKFMHEMVCVNVAESTNPNDQAVFPLWCNGKSIFITRGENIWVHRYFIEVLARAKPADYKVTVLKNAEGDVVNRATRSSALAYPFTVVQDRNPRGRVWLRDLMRQG